MKYISSRDNPTFKRLHALVEDARTRRKECASVIDGEHLLEAALDANWPIGQIVLREDLADSSHAQAYLQRCPEQTVVTVMPDSLFKHISPVVTATGFLAEIEIPAESAAPVRADGDVLALAGVQDAGNLGSLLRTALAAGIKTIWLDRQTTQAWSPKALRAGMGAQFHLSIAEHCDLLAVLADCAQQVLVTSLAADCAALYELDLRCSNVWVFGAEGQGVPVDIQNAADKRVRIPMPGQIESLNVGAAAAVCLFEQMRQRL